MSALLNGLQSVRSPNDLRIFVRDENILDPEVRQKVLGQIFDNPEKFSSLVSTIFSLNQLVTIFPELTQNSPLRDRFFVQLSKVDCGDTISNTYLMFEGIFGKFVRSEIPHEEQVTVCKSLLRHLPTNTHAFRFFSNKYQLSKVIVDYPNLQKEFLEIFRPDLNCEDVLELASKEKGERQEKVQREKAETEIKEVIARKEKSRGPYVRMILGQASDSTQLHKVAGSMNTDSKAARDLLGLEGRKILEARDKSGMTPLMCATSTGNKMMTLTLLSWGARVAVNDEDGYKPKMFTLFYDCDHEFDPGACIPLKQYMDSPFRKLLGRIEALEIAHLTSELPMYSLEKIHADLLALIGDEAFQDSKPIAALYGYMFHHLDKSEQDSLKELFLKNCKVDILKEKDLFSSTNLIKE